MAPIRNLVTDSWTRYFGINLGISPTDEITRRIVSETFGTLKRQVNDLAWMGIGLDPNVTAACEDSMGQRDDKNSFEIPAVGIMQPFDNDGESILGRSSLYLIS